MKILVGKDFEEFVYNPNVNVLVEFVVPVSLGWVVDCSAALVVTNSVKMSIHLLGILLMFLISMSLALIFQRTISVVLR